MALTGKALKKGLRVRFSSDRSVSGSGAQCTVEALSLESLWKLYDDIKALIAEVEGEHSLAPGSKPFPTILGPAKDDKVHITQKDFDHGLFCECRYA